MAESNRVLLICDNEDLLVGLREQLMVEGGYSVVFEMTSSGGINAIKDNNFDVVFIKLKMTDLPSEDLVKGIRKIDPDAVIIAILEQVNPQILKELLGLGAFEYVTLPINSEKLFFLIKNGGHLHSLIASSRKLMQGLKEQNQALEKQNTLLAKRIEESTKNLTRLYEDLRSTYMRTIKVLAQAIDARDHYTHSHSQNVAKFALAIAVELGLSAKDMELLREACELHDLGKIGVEDNILSKTGPLNEQEWDQIKRHPLIGAQILEPLIFLNDVIELIRQHHEHFDGSGYPEGRKGEDILLGARIIHVADAYESMRSERSYRPIPLSKEEAVAEIKKFTNIQFDPKVVNAFLKVVDKL
ncbi:MAG: HD domain-containing protein [Candidatus Omnitrophica bacterium]|nr:HD domain-containing protein [Candidatus Omnitrophota bacterium]